MGVLECNIQEKTNLLWFMQELEGVSDVDTLKKLRTEIMVLKDHEDLVWR